jgi:hypothetical protein
MGIFTIEYCEIDKENKRSKVCHDKVLASSRLEAFAKFDKQHNNKTKARIIIAECYCDY